MPESTRLIIVVMNEKQQRDSARQMNRKDRAHWQCGQLNQLLQRILPHNRLYAEKLGGHNVPLTTLKELASLPFTFKNELLADSGDVNLPTNLTYPEQQYVRYHRTSGTRGRPLVVMDTSDDWLWWCRSWQFVLDAADINPGDRALLAFSFGPFIGFWSAFDALNYRKVMTIPAGSMSSVARLELIRTAKANVIFCTPSYALHLVEVGRENQIDVADLGIQRIVVAGEPGGSIPEVRQQIQTRWNAQLIDHAGASEVGPWGFNTPDGAGLFVNEHDFIAEFRSLETHQAAREGELSELILTTLGRTGSPVIRYRTGDLVRPFFVHDYDSTFVFLKGGVLGRADDMMIIRGVNIFPSSIEQIIRSFPEVTEFRMTAFKKGHLDSLKIEVEDRLDAPERIARELMVRLNLKVEVIDVPPGTLPRFEMKGQRFIDRRQENLA